MESGGVRRGVVAVLAVLVASAGMVVLGASVAPAAGPLGYTVVFTQDGCQVVTVDVSTGATTVLSEPATIDACLNDLALSPDGRLFGLDEIFLEGVQLVEFDPTTGAILAKNFLSGDFSVNFLQQGGLAFDAAGVLYAQLATDEPGCNPDLGCLYIIDPATQVATLVGDSNQSDTAYFFLSANCAGAMLTTQETLTLDSTPQPSASDDPTMSDTPPRESPDVGAQNGLLGIELADVDPATGGVTPGASLPEDFDLLGLEYDRVTGVLYALGAELSPEPGSIDATQVFDDIGIYVIDPATAAITRVADFDDDAGFPQGLAIGGTCPVEAPLIVTFTG